jgi:hypothetical protein
MILPTTWTVEQRDQLAANIAMGVQSMTFAGPPQRVITFPSLESMRALLAQIDRQLSGAPVTRHISFRTGFGRSDV